MLVMPLLDNDRKPRHIEVIWFFSLIISRPPVSSVAFPFSSDLSSLQTHPFIPTNEIPLELTLFATNELTGAKGNRPFTDTQLRGRHQADHFPGFSDPPLLAWSSKYLFTQFHVHLWKAAGVMSQLQWGSHLSIKPKCKSSRTSLMRWSELIFLRVISHAVSTVWGSVYAACGHVLSFISLTPEQLPHY